MTTPDPAPRTQGKTFEELVQDRLVELRRHDYEEQVQREAERLFRVERAAARVASGKRAAVTIVAL